MHGATRARAQLYNRQRAALAEAVARIVRPPPTSPDDDKLVLTVVLFGDGSFSTTYSGSAPSPYRRLLRLLQLAPTAAVLLVSERGSSKVRVPMRSFARGPDPGSGLTGLLPVPRVRSSCWLCWPCVGARPPCLPSSSFVPLAHLTATASSRCGLRTALPGYGACAAAPSAAFGLIATTVAVRRSTRPGARPCHSVSRAPLRPPPTADLLHLCVN